MGLQKTEVASHKAWTHRFRLQEACQLDEGLLPTQVHNTLSASLLSKERTGQVPETEVTYLGGLMRSPTYMAKLAATATPVFQLVFQGAFINL